MSENEIISILSKFSVEIILLAGLTSVLTGVIKKYLPVSLKNLIHLIPFALGIIIYAGYSFLVLKSLVLVEIIKNGLKIGGVAILIYALIKQLSRKSSNAKNAVEDILKGFVDDASLSGAVTRILKEYDTAKTTNANGASVSKAITKIIAETSKVSEADSLTLGNLVTKTLDTLLAPKTVEKTAKSK